MISNRLPRLRGQEAIRKTTQNWSHPAGLPIVLPDKATVLNLKQGIQRKNDLRPVEAFERVQILVPNFVERTQQIERL